MTVAHIPKGNATHGASAPTPALRRAGVRVALATDNMHADLIEVMRWALANARLREGGIDTDWRPAAVLAMATSAGAEAMGLGERIGRLVPGYEADLITVDLRRAHLTPALDPVGTLVHCGQGRDVNHVMVQGRLVVENGRALLVDEERIRREAAAAAAALWERAGGHRRWLRP